MTGEQTQAQLAPPFTPELELLRSQCREFVTSELLPNADQWEADEWFPNEVFKRCADEGLLGLKYPKELGGSDRGYLADAVFTEELSRCRSGGVAAGIGAHVGIATPPIWKFGTESQQLRYLAPAITGQQIAALGITEPDAGSDVAGLKTSAKQVEGGYLVNGSKMYITNGIRADFIVTAVKTKPEGGHQGISFFVIERGEGIEASKLSKLGWRASDTALISFDNVFVPEENLLGELHGGFYLIMANFQWERLLMALGAVGSMQDLLERTIDFALTRNSFGKPIGKHQAIRHQLADVATQLAAGRALTYEALRRFANGENVLQLVTQAKLFTQRAALQCADRCLQIHGGAGYVNNGGNSDPVIERALRDARLGPIGGGTDEIMKEILGKTYGL
mgnify:CR=1 FL=1